MRFDFWKVYFVRKFNECLLTYVIILGLKKHFFYMFYVSFNKKKQFSPVGQDYIFPQVYFQTHCKSKNSKNTIFLCNVFFLLAHFEVVLLKSKVTFYILYY